MRNEDFASDPSNAFAKASAGKPRSWRRLPAEASAKEGFANLHDPAMHYVYLLRSIDHPDQTYIGLTADLKKRLQKHNYGEVPHTSKYKPWTLVAYTAFQNREQAASFETYLKSGSGRAFAKRRLW